MSRLAWVLLLLGALSGCTSMGRLEKGAPSLSPKESAFVLGVGPDGYRVSIFPGSVEDGKFRQSTYRNAAFAGHPEDGFVVSKVSEGDTVAITRVTAVKDKDSVMGARFKACDGAKTMVFRAPATGGKVLYLGNVHYEMTDTQLRVQYSSDIDAAKRYIDANYPALSGRLEPWKYDLIPLAGSCRETIYVPSIPMRR